MTAEVVESFTKEPGDGNRTVLAMGGRQSVEWFPGGHGRKCHESGWSLVMHTLIFWVCRRLDVIG